MPELSNDIMYSQKKFYISDKQCKYNKYWFSWQNLKVYFCQLGMTFHGMGPLCFLIITNIKMSVLHINAK